MNRVENMVTKGEIAHNEQFSLLLQCFQKLSATGASANGKGLISSKKDHIHVHKVHVYVDFQFILTGETNSQLLSQLQMEEEKVHLYQAYIQFTQNRVLEGSLTPSTSRPSVAISFSLVGKKVARINILQSWVNK